MKLTRHELIAMTAFWITLVGLAVAHITYRIWPAIVACVLVGAVIGLDHWPAARAWLARPARWPRPAIRAWLAVLAFIATGVRIP